MIRSITYPFLQILFISISCLFLFSGCGREADDESDKLVVYTYDAFPEALEESLKTIFSADTEFSLERFQDTGALFNQVMLEKKSPRADIVIGLDNTYLARTYKENLFESYKPEGIDLIDATLVIDSAFRLIAFDYGSVALNYDSRLLLEPPETWEELLSPELKGKIILMNPATSSPGRIFLLFTVAEFGEEGYLSFWERLKPNILTVVAGWYEGYGLYTQGEAPIVLSYATSPAYHLHFEKEDRYKNLLIGGKAFMQIEVAGIVKNAPHRENAETAMDHLLSVEFQNLIPLNQFMYPVHPDAVLPEAFITAGQPREVLFLDEETIAGKLDGWLESWEKVMQ